MLYIIFIGYVHVHGTVFHKDIFIQIHIMLGIFFFPPLSFIPLDNFASILMSYTHNFIYLYKIRTTNERRHAKFVFLSLA